MYHFSLSVVGRLSAVGYRFVEKCIATIESRGMSIESVMIHLPLPASPSPQLYMYTFFPYFFLIPLTILLVLY